MIKSIKTVRENLITKEKKQIRHWADHFKGLLNQPSPATRPEIPPPSPARTELPACGHQSSNESSNPKCDQATEVRKGRNGRRNSPKHCKRPQKLQ
ncbi:unnamed protein product [Trichobilharzia regenti]|nr:unnamed protein product [Trichobilharzia regenti]